MRVAVLNNMVPFLHDGAEELALHLARHLEEAGHLVDLVRIPFRWEPLAVLPAEIVKAQQMRLDAADKVIPLKFPAYLVPHENKTLWLLRQSRQAYDLLDTAHSHVSSNVADLEIRDRIIGADSEAFAGARAIYTNAEVVSDRLREAYGFASEVLQPPMFDAELFVGREAEGYVFAGGRVNDFKRQALLIEALAKTPPSVKLVVMGPPEDADTAARLERRADELGVRDRLTLDLRFTTREEIADRVARATACAYVPFDEDSMGYVTLEAAEAGKPMITTTDSGGVQQMVVDGHSGWVVPPTADALAEAMTAATSRPAVSAERGAALQSVWRAMDATWPTTIERLLA